MCDLPIVNLSIVREFYANFPPNIMCDNSSTSDFSSDNWLVCVRGQKIEFSPRALMDAFELPHHGDIDLVKVFVKSYSKSVVC